MKTLLLGLCLPLAAAAPAQDHASALAEARLLERQEGDLRGAEVAYRGLLADPVATTVHAEAALRLGAMLWRLDRRDDARPLLERAVAAGGEAGAEAQAILQGQGDEAEAKAVRRRRALELVAHLEELLPAAGDARNAAWQQSVEATRSDLRWLGDAAAAAVTEWLEVRCSYTGSAAFAAGGQPEQLFHGLAAEFWRIGTPTATAWLERVMGKTSVEFRRALSAAVPEAIAPDLQAGVMMLLQQPDPTHDTSRNLTEAVARLPLPTVLELCRDAAPGARAAAFAALGSICSHADADQLPTTFAALQPLLPGALRADDPAVARAAWTCLTALALGDLPEARRMLFTELPGARHDFAMGSRKRITLEDADIELLQRMATGSNEVARRAAHWWFSAHEPRWTAASVRGVITLIEHLGTVSVACAPRLVASAGPDELARLVTVLPRLVEPKAVFAALRERADEDDLPAAAGAALRVLIDDCLRQPPQGWRATTVARGPRQVGEDLRTCFDLLGRAPDAGHADWLLAVVRREPLLEHEAVEAALHLSLRDCPGIARALRALLVWEGSPEARLHPRWRNQVWLELTLRGDTDALPLFARAQALGLDHDTLWWHNERGRGSSLARARRPSLMQDTMNSQALPTTFGKFGSIGGLCDVAFVSGREAVAWHGYDDATLRGAWRDLLTGPAAETVWPQIAALDAPAFVPLPALPLVAAALATRWPTGDERAQNALQRHLLRSFQRVTEPALAADPALQPAIVALLTGDVELGRAVLAHLPYDVVRAVFVEPALGLLAQRPEPYQLELWRRAKLPLRAEHWRFALAAERSMLRVDALQHLPGPLDGALRPSVEACLRDERSEVRSAACAAIARLAAQDSVATLLGTLNDQDADVRKAATQALETLRFQREQRTFWQSAGDGLDARPEAALAKLLQQARAGEAKEQRLLAIRSLAALGRAEAAPHLIDWSKDADSDVAAAARATLTALLDRLAPR